jgi:hypothetical protein
MAIIYDKKQSLARKKNQGGWAGWADSAELRGNSAKLHFQATPKTYKSQSPDWLN